MDRQPPCRKATSVDVTVDSDMLKKSAGFLAGRGGDSAKLQELIDGIRGIYVKHFEFNAPGAYTDADVEAVRKQVAREGWSRIVGVKGKGELTEIYLWKEAVNGGLVGFRGGQRTDDRQHRGHHDLASLAALGSMIQPAKVDSYHE
jgi:hypothetical protein